MDFKATALIVPLVLSLVAVSAVNGSQSEDDADVSIGVVGACDVVIPSFQAPNGGFLGRNSTGVFQASILNNGSYANTTVNASLKVSYLKQVTNQTLQNPDTLNLTNISERYDENISTPSKNYIENLTDQNGTAEYNFSALSNSTRIFLDSLEFKRDVNLSVVQDQTDGFSLKRDFDNFTSTVGLSPGNRRAQYIKFFYAAPEYPLGEYEATLNLDYRCLAFNSSSGRQNRPIFKEENKTVDFNIVKPTGGISNVGNQSTNRTLPQDVNRTGEESDQQLEGNNPNPGTTPQPEPEPEPEPDPKTQLELEPVNRTYTVERQEDKRIPISVRNLGNETISDITISPQIQALTGSWQGNDAGLTELSANSRVNRSVVVRAPQSAEPRLYTVPVTARRNGSQLDTDYFYVRVQKTSFEPRFEILEAPRSVQLVEGSTQQLPILVRNTGRDELTEVTAEIQNIGTCADVRSETIDLMEPNETASLSVQLNASNNSQTCEATLLVNSEEGAFAYSNLVVTVSPEEGVIPERQQPPLFAIIWTVLLVAYSVFRKRMDSDSLGVNAPLILLVVGEALILLYLLVGHYGVISVPFLPF